MYQIYYNVNCICIIIINIVSEKITIIIQCYIYQTLRHVRHDIGILIKH